MPASVLIDYDAQAQRPELFIDGRKIDLDAVRRIEFCYVPGAAATLTVEYCIGSGHTGAADHA
jgi:hypothetical protein